DGVGQHRRPRRAVTPARADQPDVMTTNRAHSALERTISAIDVGEAAGQPMPAELRAVADAAKGFLPADEADALYDAAWAMAPYGPLLEVGTYCGKSATF